MAVIHWGDAAVAGLLGAAGIVFGVVVAEWLVRVRERRREIERATIKIATLLPYVFHGLLAGVRMDMSIGSEWGRQRDEVGIAASSIRTSARWSIRNAAAIRKAALDVNVRLTAAHMRYALDSRPFANPQELLQALPSALAALVFPGDEPIDALVEEYRRNGFGS